MNRIFIIAIADPDPGFCAYCKKIFEHRGYVVIVSNSPNELYQAVSEELVDLVVLSTDFPDRNATDICYDIRKIPEYFNLPIIFTSAELDESEILYCLGVGGSDFLIKPISDQELLAKISFALHTFNKMNDRFGGLPLGCRVGGRS